MNPVSKCQKLTGLTRGVVFGHDAPGSQWKTRAHRFITHAGNNFHAVAKKADSSSLSSARCLSNNAQGGNRPVKRVSIEGNIGKMLRNQND